MRIFSLVAALCLGLLASQAPAQTYPDYQSTTVNDFADLLPPEIESQVVADLDKLRADTGIEMTVVTLQLRAFHDPEASLEQFATNLFDRWGIGDKDRNDGILLLVLRGDREVRIELGAGFGRDWDREAAQVIDRSILPAFREDRYADGIVAGVNDTIGAIALPFHAGAAAPSGGGASWLWGLGGFAGVFALLFSGAWIPHLRARFSTCPSCGARGLKLKRQVLRAATRASTGQGRSVTSCSSCGHSTESLYSISRISKTSSSSSSSFGGGRSGGGGASGKW